MVFKVELKYLLVSLEPSQSAGGSYEMKCFRYSCVFAIWGFFTSRSPSEQCCQGKGLFHGEPSYSHRWPH